MLLLTSRRNRRTEAWPFSQRSVMVHLVVFLIPWIFMIAALPNRTSFLLAHAAYPYEGDLKRARDMLSQADALLARGDIDEAISSYDLALQALNVRLQDPLRKGRFVNVGDVRDPTLAGEILQHKAKAQFRVVLERRDPQGRPLEHILRSAFDSAAASKTLLEYTRAQLRLGEEQAKLNIARKLRTSYDMLIEISYLLRRRHPEQVADSAFSISQRSRTRVLLDLQWAKQEIRFSGKKLSDLRTLLSQVALVGTLERSLAEELDENQPRPKIIDQLRGRLIAAHAHIRKIERALKGVDRSFSLEILETSYPEEGGLSFRPMLEIKDAIIQYHVTSNHVFAFVIRDVGKIEFVRLRIHPRTLKASIEAYHEKLKRELGTWKQAASDLYMLLFVELLPYLQNTERIFIVPSRILHYLPFQTLVDPMTQEYGLGQFRISYLPHAELLGAAGPLGEIDREFRVMVVGINQFETKRQLKWSEDEAKAVADVFGKRADLFLGSRGEATKQKVTPRLPNYSLIHISSHAEFDRRPMLSRIILKDEGGGDTWLSAFDFLGLETGLQPGLITLSACDTGQGRIDPGDDFLGLPRALFFAGARVVVASLWPVEQRSTALLMSQFYRELAKPDVTIDEALPRAKDWLRVEYPEFSHPHYWAPFVVIGDGRLVFTRRPTPRRSG